MARIRRATIDDLPAMARVRVDTWRSAYAGIVPSSHLESLSYERIAERWRQGLFGAQPEVVAAFVAETGEGDVVGIAICGPEEGSGWEGRGQVHVLYVLPTYQRRGIGRLFMQACASHLLAQRMHSLTVWVLEANPYRKFYETLGGVVDGEKEVEIGGAFLSEIAYRWSDVGKATWMMGHPAAISLNGQDVTLPRHTALHEMLSMQTDSSEEAY